MAKYMDSRKNQIFEETMLEAVKKGSGWQAASGVLLEEGEVNKIIESSARGTAKTAEEVRADAALLEERRVIMLIGPPGSGRGGYQTDDVIRDMFVQGGWRKIIISLPESVQTVLLEMVKNLPKESNNPAGQRFFLLVEGARSSAN